MLSLTPFRRVVKDYFLVCESYYKAIRNRRPRRSRRSTWDAAACTTKAPRFCGRGSKGKIDVDFDTARRLFTLICVLHLRG